MKKTPLKKFGIQNLQDDSILCEKMHSTIYQLKKIGGLWRVYYPLDNYYRGSDVDNLTLDNLHLLLKDRKPDSYNLNWETNWYVIEDAYDIQKLTYDLDQPLVTLREQDRKNIASKLKKIGFAVTSEGVIAYKTFNCSYPAPKEWRIRAGATITSTCLFNPLKDCGEGINVGTFKWVEQTYGHCEDYSAIRKPRVIWKCLIPYEWLDRVVVPEGTEGKIRCEAVKLIESIPYNDRRRVSLRKKEKIRHV